MLTVKQNTTVIADGSASGGSVVGDIDVNGSGLADVVPTIGAAGPEVFDRITQELRITITVLRQHGSAEAAEAHRFLARTRTANTGALIIERETETAIHRYTAAKAHWAEVGAPKYEGECSIITYRVICGPLIYSTDTPGDHLGDYVDGGAGYDAEYGPGLGVLDAGLYGEEGVPAELAVDGGSY